MALRMYQSLRTQWDSSIQINGWAEFPYFDLSLGELHTLQLDGDMPFLNRSVETVNVYLGYNQLVMTVQMEA